jgi:hypothetical protein
MLYFEIIPKELLEIIISKINHKYFLDLVSIMSLYNLDYNHILKLKYPKLLNIKKIYLSDYTSVLSDYEFKYIDVNDYQYIIFESNAVLIDDLERINNELIYLADDYGINLNIELDENDKIIQTKEMYDVVPKIIFATSDDNEYIHPFLTNEEKDILPSIKKLTEYHERNLICIKTNNLSIYYIKKVIDSILLGTSGHIDIKKISVFTTFTGLKILYYKLYI